MNCDDVFVILTRGPFPSGSQDDAEVERHLQVCMECHRLAEALRPNDAALRDATGEQEISALPGYWGDLVSAPALSVTDTADFSRPKRAAQLRSNRQLAKNLNVGQFAAAVALGIVLAAALRTLVTVTPKQTMREPPGARADRQSTALDGIDYATALPVAHSKCWRFEMIGALPDSGVTKAAVVGLLQACSTCHSEAELNSHFPAARAN